MNSTTAIFKIGGKLLEDFDNLNSTISQLKQIYEEKLVQKVIIIPGGGTIANFIRKVYSELKFTEEIAHFMGIISMNYNGLELSKKYPDIQVIESFNKLTKMGNTISIFLPYEYLKENDTLPHSWDVTSDSITLFLAKKLGLNECFLIKDVDGILDEKNNVIKELSTSEFRKLKKSGKLAELKKNIEELKERTNPIDPFIISLIEKYNIACIILNGSKYNKRIFDYFKSHGKVEKIYTKIIK